MQNLRASVINDCILECKQKVSVLYCFMPSKQKISIFLCTALAKLTYRCLWCH